MDKEHPHTLAKLAALQARCDRLEKAFGTMLAWSVTSYNSPLSMNETQRIYDILKGNE